MHHSSNPISHCWACLGIAILLLTIPTSSIAQSAAQPSGLTKIWEADLGPVSSSAFYRLTVCPEGTAYLTDGNGRLAVLDSSGKVLSDTDAATDLGGSVALTCDDRGRLISASGRSLVTMERKGAHLETSAVVPLDRSKIRPHQIIAADDETFFVVGISDGKSFVHTLDRQGNLLKSFGEAPSQLTPGLATKAASRGSAVWNKSTGQLVYLPMNPFEVRVYDGNGALIKRRADLDREFGAMRYDSEFDTSPAGDEVTYATYLPGGELLVQTVKREALPSGGHDRKNYLNILDRNIQLTRSFYIGRTFGILQGSSADGTLYFARINVPTGIHIIAAKLANP